MARNLLKYEVNVGVKEGLKRVVKWYANLKNA